MPTAAELDRYLDTAFPKEIGIPGDTGGIMLLADSGSSDTVVCALDVTGPALRECVSRGAGILVTHHPLFFGSLDSVRCDTPEGKLLIFAARHGISLLAYHTRLDEVAGGVNDCLCQAIGLSDFRTLGCCSRIGTLPFPVDAGEFAANIGKSLGSDRVMLFRHRDSSSVVAVCSGSGGGILRDAYLAGADTLVVGEAKYGCEKDSAEYGINLITAGHRETEQPVLPFLADTVRRGFPGTEVFTFYA